MKKLSKKTRQLKAVAEADAHVRKFGLADVDDWAYTIATHRGFEEDEAFINWLAAYMRFTQANAEAQAAGQEYKREEERYRRWKMERDRYQEMLDKWKPSDRWFPLRGLRNKEDHIFEQRWQEERKKANS